MLEEHIVDLSSQLISRVKAQDFQENFINRWFPIFSQTKKKVKIKYSQRFRVLKNKFTKNGFKGFEFWKTHLQTMGLKVREKKSFIFLSLRLQNYIMVIFFRNVFWVYGYPAYIYIYIYTFKK